MGVVGKVGGVKVVEYPMPEAKMGIPPVHCLLRPSPT